MMTENRKRIPLVILIFSIMLIIGFLANLRGALLPSIKQDLGINYSNIGLLIVVTGIWYMFATFVAGFLCDRIGHKSVLAIGFLLVILGIVGITFTKSFAFLFVTMTVMCLGLGCFDIALNSLAPKLFLVNTAVMLSFLHVFFGVGAAISPQFGSFFLSRQVPWNQIYGYSLVLIIIVFVIFLITPSIPRIQAQRSSSAPLNSIFKDGRVWMFIAVLAFCESTEVGLTNWLVNFLQVERGMTAGSSAQYMFYFFITYTVGRLFGGYLAEKIGYVKIISIFVSTAFVLLAGGLFLGNAFAFLFSITGWFISIMFPTVITLISKEFPENSSSVMGVIITGAGISCNIVNWVIGKINDTLGVFAGFSTILIYAAMVVILLGILSRKLTFCSKVPEDQGNVLCGAE